MFPHILSTIVHHRNWSLYWSKVIICSKICSLLLHHNIRHWVTMSFFKLSPFGDFIHSRYYLRQIFSPHLVRRRDSSVCRRPSPWPEQVSASRYWRYRYTRASCPPSSTWCARLLLPSDAQSSGCAPAQHRKCNNSDNNNHLEVAFYSEKLKNWFNNT